MMKQITERGFYIVSREKMRVKKDEKLLNSEKTIKLGV